MSSFRRYDHLERLGHRDVDGILHGTVHVFPKVDGTNASLWHDGDKPCCGSRNRALSEDSDNAGFWKAVHSDTGQGRALRSLARAFPPWIFYGEWLVPHTIKDYREDAWRRFWIFDVYDREAGHYLRFDCYKGILDEYGVDYIPPVCTVVDPSEQQLVDMLEHNFYLMQDGKGAGEGIVIKNYEWTNIYDRQPWAKLVRTAHKEANAKEFGHGERKGRLQVEVAIADEVVTETLVRKELAKVLNALRSQTAQVQDWEDCALIANYRKRVIPWILSQVYNCVIEEELWTQLKKHRNPTIDFKTLNGRVTHNVKKHLPEIF